MMRCIRGQHSKGATNWIMTHEGQIWAGDLASKVAMGSRSVLHSRLLILSRQTGTPAFAAPHTHAHTHMNTYTSHVLCAKSQCPSRQRAQVVVIDWIKRLKINACLLAPKYSTSSRPCGEKVWTSGALSTQYPDLPLIHPPPTRPSSFPHAETPECRGCG